MPKFVREVSDPSYNAVARESVQARIIRLLEVLREWISRGDYSEYHERRFEFAKMLLERQRKGLELPEVVSLVCSRGHLRKELQRIAEEAETVL